MKRHEKLTLLTKVIRGNITEYTKQQLRQSIDHGPIIAIIRTDNEGPKLEDEIWIQNGTQRISMLYRDLDNYATQEGNTTIFLLPDNYRN